MSATNTEIVRRSIDAFSRGDLDTILAALAPEFEFESSGRFVDTRGVSRGPAGFAGSVSVCVRAVVGETL